MHTQFINCEQIGRCVNRMLGYLIIVCASIYATNVLAQSDLWQASNTASKTSSTDTAIQYFDSDDQALRSKLNVVPNELRGQSETIFLPMPDGTLSKYSIVEYSTMEGGLSEEFPQIKSYKVYGIDDPAASGRVDISPKGFRGMLMTSQGRVFIDPVSNTTSANRYKSSLRTAGYGQSGQAFQCDVHALSENNDTLETNFSRNNTVNRVSGSLIIYRLAVSATSEYVTAVGGTLITAMAEINTAINRVNQIYERDLGIRLFLVNNNSSIIELPGTNVGFTNNDGFALLAENQSRIDSIIGDANYDIGHVFSTSGGGIARLGAVCGTGIKAQGVTGLPSPIGDEFYVDYVAHEIGHQFGGNHTFNGSTGSCLGNRNASTAFEPGSGSSILGYSGLCGVENIASNSDVTFHAGTIAEINAFVSAGGGASCTASYVITPANSDPTSVNAGIDRVIPRSTPFLMLGSAVDAGDTLTYSWDQMDAGATTTAANLGTDLGNNPLFRSHIPQPTGVRYFPSLRSQLDNTTTLGETLPTMARILNFRMTVRDGKSGQGTDDVAVTVAVGTTSAFAITSHAIGTTIDATGGATVATVNWLTGNTENAPVNCATVDIDLLTFSADGNTFGETTLMDGALNDGSQDVVIPDMSNLQARFLVQCSNNIFYDISHADLIITGTGGSFPTTGNSTNTSTAANFTNVSTVGGPTNTAGGGGGGGVANSLLLTFLLSLGLSGYWLRGRMSEEPIVRLLVNRQIVV